MKITPSHALALFLAGVSLARAQDGSVRVIASSGTTAPGLTGNFTSFTEPVLNSSGTVAFLGYATGQAVYLSSATGLVNLAKSGQTAPVINGAFSGFSAPILNESGVVAFTGSNTLASQAIYTTANGALTTIAAAASSGQTFSNFPSAIALNDTGIVAFEVEIGSPVTSSGIDRGSGGSLTVIVTTTQTAPGTGGLFSNPAAPVLNNVGVTAFSSVNTVGQGIYISLGNAQIPIATTATAAPGIGGNFANFFGNPTLNDNNTVAFVGISSISNAKRGIFTGSGSALSIIATTDTAAPGLTGNFTTFSEPALNSAGTVAFTSRASSGVGIYTSTGGALQTVAVTGQVAPTIGGTFSDLGTGFNKKSPALNSFGGTAFLGTSTNGKTGLFLGDGLQLITAAFADPSGTGSTITGITFTGGSDRGGAAQFNDNGQVTYIATLGSGASSIQLFTPTLHIRSGVSGTWATRSAWTLGILPAAVHDVVIDPAAALTITGPMLSTTVKSLAVNGSGANVSELTLQSTGTISAPGGVSIGSSGRLGGSGKLVVGTAAIPSSLTLTSAGTIAPGTGLAAGAISITGNVTLQSTAHLAFDLGGTLRKTGFDFLNVTGQLALGSATLDVALMGGFSPLAGSSFDLFDAASVTGTFGTVHLPTLSGGLTWNTALLPTTGVISIALSTAPTTYTLAASASAATIHAGGSSTITATITNTGAAGTDTLNFSGLNVSASPAGGTVTGVTLALAGAALANGNGAQSGTATFSSAVGGTYTLTPVVASATNATLGSAATNAGVTAASIAVFSGAAKWVAAGPASWGTGAGANWTDTAAASVHAAPGTFSGFAANDTAVFDGTSGGSIVTLDGAAPSLAALTLTGGSYTIAQGTGGTLTLNGGAGSAIVTDSAGSHTVSAPVLLATNATATVTTAGSTLTLGAVTGAGKTLTKTGAGTLILSGAQTYAVLNANGGTTRVTGSFTGGTAIVHANATTKFEASQTLAALFIADGVEVTFGNGAGAAFDDPSVKADGLAVVPEPGTAALLLVGALGLLARRRRA